MLSLVPMTQTLLDAESPGADTLAEVSGARPALIFCPVRQAGCRHALFSSREVVCGPDVEPRSIEGRIQGLRTPFGRVDLSEVIKQLPKEQQPELVVVKADGTGRSFPRNLAAVAGPKVLLVGDGQHPHQPIRRLIHYAREERFDFIIFGPTRQHAPLFAAAGLRSLYWLPALGLRWVCRESPLTPSLVLTFVGQVDRQFPRRVRVLDQLRTAGLPLELLQGTPDERADFFADSKVTVNVSRNGELNPRIFESLAAGGFLLTDELAPAAGLGRLFESGRHLDTWRRPEELVEKIRYYLSHTQEALRIRRAGQDEMFRSHLPETKLRAFYELIDHGRVNPVYDLSGEPWWRTAETVGGPLRAAAAYEAVQEEHRIAERVTIAADAPLPAVFAEFPRVATVPTSAPADMLWWQESTPVDALAAFAGSRVIALSAEAARRPELADWGFEPEESGGPILGLAQPGRFFERAWASGASATVRARLQPLLERTGSPDECLLVAAYAERLDDRNLQRAAFRRAVELDRNNQAGLIGLALLAREMKDDMSTFAMLEEAARVHPLAPATEALRQELLPWVSQEPRGRAYLRMVGRWTVSPSARPRRILILTNVFPPQEMGEYGRMMWEFAQGLRARGHAVRILTANLPALAKEPTPDEADLEGQVSRSLELFGEWRGGRPTLYSHGEAMGRNHGNLRQWRTELDEFRPDFVLAGNLDLLGPDMVQAALNNGYPVLHALANSAPGFSAAIQPHSPRYWIAPCSDWNGLALRQGGYAPARMETVYPGARVDRFFRLLLPDNTRLRICYAGLILPAKGVHVFLNALIRLHLMGVEFTAEIAGDAPDPAFLQLLKEATEDSGLARKVGFPGFLDRSRLAALFARSNVLVFPSQTPEPFGISQVEAMAAGLVVVTSGTGGAKEIVRSGTDGLHFMAERSDDLAEKLHLLVQDRPLMARLQRAAQTRAAELSVDHATERIEEMMEAMLALPDGVAADGVPLASLDDGY